MKVFVINPERGATEKERFFTENLVKMLESDDHEVWISKRDNPDNISVVEKNHINLGKILEADIVYVVYSKSSLGSIFELGWLWCLLITLGKIPVPQIVFANKSWFENDNSDQFLNVLHHLEITTSK